MGKNNHEELLGGTPEATSNKQTVEDNLLGRPHVAEKSFAPEAKKDALAPKTPEERFAELQRLTSVYLSEDDEAMLAKAFRFASEAHEGQCRKSGEPFVAHPVEVAIILADLRMDVETLCAALLHDTVEDTSVTRDQVEAEFNPQVAQLVEGVTKITRIEVESLTDEQAATIRKMFVAMSKDIRVIVIKLADRLHNMRTLGALREDRRIFKARETLEIYAPIAHRLGINNIKWELEDLSFYYLEPNKFKQISRMVTESRSEREGYLDQIISILHDEMEKVNIQAQIMGRPKHLYSIYQKMTKKGKGFSEIYDLIAVRVIVKSVKDCYSALGAVHTLWHPMPGRFKDYIAMPKFNMYQSLHTTVIGPAGRPLEVQIRTEDMHRQSEYGVAAHWRYKGVNQGAQTSEMWLGRLRELLEDTTHSLAQRFDAKPASGEIFVFTPNGDLRKLPEGASLLDFAFDIHTSLGSTCVGGKVNNRAVSIREQLHNGDIVEILTQKNQTPKSDWLNFVVTSKARNKIKSYLREEQAKHTRMGREELERKLKNWKFTLTIDEAVAYLVKYFKVRTGTEVYALIATQKVDLGTIKEILARHISGEADEQRRAAAAEAERNKVHNVRESTAPQDALVIDDDISKIQYKLAKCCNPIKGDDVFGFVTINSGITIHRNDCPNAKRMRENYPYRVIEARWRSTAEGAFRVSIRIVAADTTGMANHITEVISRDLKLNIRSINFSSLANGCIGGTVSVEVPGAGVVDTLIHSIMRIKGVQRAFRINN